MNILPLDADTLGNLDMGNTGWVPPDRSGGGWSNPATVNGPIGGGDTIVIFDGGGSIGNDPRIILPPYVVPNNGNPAATPPATSPPATAGETPAGYQPPEFLAGFDTQTVLIGAGVIVAAIVLLTGGKEK